MKPGRVSAAELASPIIGTMPSRLTAPSSLTKAERAAFAELIASCHPSHFVASDVWLVVSYVQASLLARRSGRKGEIATFEKATRLQATLATKLRLSPQSRTDPKTTGRQAANHIPGLRKPWELIRERNNDDDDATATTDQPG